jgi:hypothetical protein
MRGDRQVLVLRYQRETLHNGTVECRRYLPVTTSTADIAAAEAESNGKAELVAEVRTWLSLGSPMAETADRVLLWLEAYSKTTLKGLGRQYAAGLNLDAAEETWQVRGGARSGRYGTQAALVVCAPGAPIGKWHREGGATTATSPWPDEPFAEAEDVFLDADWGD